MKYLNLPLIIAAFLGSTTLSAAPPAGPVYTSSQYGLSLQPPAGYTKHDGVDGDVFTPTSFALVNGTVLVSFVVLKKNSSDSPVLGAGVALAKITPVGPIGCKTIGMGENTTGSLTLYHGSGGSSLGTRLDQERFYLVPHGQDCFEIMAKLAVETTKPIALTAEQQGEKLDQLLDSVALTLKFN